MKIGCIGALSFSALILSGCGENPMLKPQSIKNLTELISRHLSLEDRVACTEYGTDPDEFESRQAICSKWMKNQYDEYATILKMEMVMDNSGSENSPRSKEDFDNLVPTFEEFLETEVWQTIWDEHGKKWTDDLEKQKAEDARRELERQKWREEQAERERKQEELHKKFEAEQEERRKLKEEQEKKEAIARKKEFDQFCETHADMYVCTHRKK